jgi:hypothetical protein
VTPQCPCCGAEQTDGILCSVCGERVQQQLGDVRALWDELYISIAKLAKLGGNSGSAGLARERSAINLGSSAAAHELSFVLRSWAEVITGEMVGPGRPPAVQAAWLLLANMGDLSAHPEVAKFVKALDDAVWGAWRAIDRGPDKKYLGKCDGEHTDDLGNTVICGNELWALPEANEIRCRVCATDHDVATKRRAMLRRADDMEVTVKTASQWIGEYGDKPVTEASIRGLIHRQKLGYVSGKLILLGDLLELLTEKRVAA